MPLSPAYVQDVLREQLEYLLKFHGVACPKQFCSECDRLHVVVLMLLKPFEESIR